MSRKTALQPSRRAFLGGAAVTAAALLSAALPGDPVPDGSAPGRGTLEDLQHVVILMQENRSVDHYYGTMRGVRGYSDKAALTYPNGRSVFFQPDSRRPDGGFLLPYHVDTAKVDGQDLAGNDHSWEGVHKQWAGGNNDGWTADTGEITMAYFNSRDVPFNRALAKSFTFCDNYFCSVKGPTGPNRLYLWSGTIDPHGTPGGPVIVNPADYEPVFHWTTYPERLQAAGVSWQVYANDEVGDAGGEDGFLGDNGDNSLWRFQAYHEALASADPRRRQLAERASVRTAWNPSSGRGRDLDHVLARFLADCRADRLPAVSWVVAPYGYSEHPRARPVDGAAYQQTILNALSANRTLWESTAMFINHDEHDGFFDHVIPPTAPVGTPDEFVDDLPVGLGPRVPMTIVSPWSRGGWIDSEVFDHTSVLRFLELWTGVREPNISAWRRAVCGDLTSAFNFQKPVTTIPLLPDTRALRRNADQVESMLPTPAPPDPGQQRTPMQESGLVPARALPYQPLANISVELNAVKLELSNRGSRTLQLSVYDRTTSPMTSTRSDIPPHGSRLVKVAAAVRYDLAIHGPNGFLCQARGAQGYRDVETAVDVTGSAGRPKLQITFSKSTRGTVSLTVTGLDERHHAVRLDGGSHSMTIDPVPQAHGWYDFSVTIVGHPEYLRRFAGHLENGQPSVTG